MVVIGDSASMPGWDASDYHQHSRGQQTWARELLGKLAWRGDERVLDVGCGDGKVTVELAELVPDGRVTGIDSSPEMIAFARAAYPRPTFPRVSFEVMDARALRFHDAFDVVFSNATLHWVVDHRPVLASIAQSLVCGGRALLQMGGRGNAASVVAVMHEVIAIDAWSSYFAGFAFPYGFHDPTSYQAWAVEAGLTPVRVELVPKDMVHQGAEAFAGWIRTTWLPYLERVPDERRGPLVEAVVSRYLERHPPDTDGAIHVPMVRLEAELRRPAQ